jgi:hypothetical protein
MKKTSIAAICMSFLSGAQAQQATNSSILDELIVTANAFEEEKPDGVYGEPEWVGHRRFARTRVYIQKDPGEIGVEEWYRYRSYDGGRVTQRFQQEFEIGLPYRMQLDIYEKLIHDNEVSGGWKQDEVAVELRYAFADWGVLWGNPTIYCEYAFAESGPDILETKLLFGDDWHGWHWGINFINEHELWGEETNEWAIAAGLSRTIIDSKLSIGLEGQWSSTEHEKSEAILGPSIQWLPTQNTHLDLVSMFGLTDSAPNAEIWLIFGFDFGSGSKKGYKPTTVGGL